MSQIKIYCILLTICISSIISDGSVDMKLVMVQGIWRHGDRTPQKTYPGDPIKEEEWNELTKFDGYGQLTEKGVQQQFELGKLLKKRYITEKRFLNERYVPASIIVRSSNKNRTIESAQSNLEGMFSKQFSPSDLQIFEDYENDCVANVFCHTKAKSDVLKLAKTLPSYVRLSTNPELQSLLKKLSNETGKEWTTDNFWALVDSLKCQRIHFGEKLRRDATWYSDELYEKLEAFGLKTNLFVTGLYESPVINNTDLSKAMLSLRGGPILNEMMDRFDQKMACQNKPKCVDRVKSLKYFAYSAHDMTMYNFMAILGLQNFAGPNDRIGEWPDYAAAIFVEFYSDKKSNMFFKIFYRPSYNFTKDFVDLTEYVTGCEENKKYCPVDVLRKSASEFSVPLTLSILLTYLFFY